MTEMVNEMYTTVVGTSSVPTVPGMMGPIQGTPGLLGTGGGVNFKDLMATASSFASASMTIFGGQQQASYLRSQGAAEAQALYFRSEQSLIDAKQAELQGQQKSNEILDNLVKTLATQRLNFSGNGMDPTFGTPVDVARSTQATADLQLSTTRSDARQLALSRRIQSASYLAQRSAALSAAKQGAGEAILKASAVAGDTLDKAYQRGLARG